MGELSYCQKHSYLIPCPICHPAPTYKPDTLAHYFSSAAAYDAYVRLTKISSEEEHETISGAGFRD